MKTYNGYATSILAFNDSVHLVLHRTVIQKKYKGMHIFILRRVRMRETFYSTKLLSP